MPNTLRPLPPRLVTVLVATSFVVAFLATSLLLPVGTREIALSVAWDVLVMTLTVLASHLVATATWRVVFVAHALLRNYPMRPVNAALCVIAMALSFAVMCAVPMALLAASGFLLAHGNGPALPMICVAVLAVHGAYESRHDVARPHGLAPLAYLGQGLVDAERPVYVIWDGDDPSVADVCTADDVSTGCGPSMRAYVEDGIVKLREIHDPAVELDTRDLLRSLEKAGMDGRPSEAGIESLYGKPFASDAVVYRSVEDVPLYRYLHGDRTAKDC